MGSLGMQEIVIIFILALIVFGPRKLPELGKTIGKGLAEFKRASNELKQTWEDEVRLDKEKDEIAQVIRESAINPGAVLADINKSLESDTPGEAPADITKSPESDIEGEVPADISKSPEPDLPESVTPNPEPKKSDE